MESVMRHGGYLIGELAQKAGVRRATLRYYERRGLLEPSGRSASGYRLYGPESEGRLHFIKRAQSFGFTLDEISLLLGLRPDSRSSCRRVLEMLDGKVRELAAELEERKRFHGELSRYRDRCLEALDRRERCPLIAEVSKE